MSLANFEIVMGFFDVTLTDVLQAGAAVIAAYLIVQQGGEIKLLLQSISQLATHEQTKLKLEATKLGLNAPDLEMQIEEDEEALGTTTVGITIVNKGITVREMNVMNANWKYPVHFTINDSPYKVFDTGSETFIYFCLSTEDNSKKMWGVSIESTDWFGNRFETSIFSILGKAHVFRPQPVLEEPPRPRPQL